MVRIYIEWVKEWIVNENTEKQTCGKQVSDESECWWVSGHVLWMSAHVLGKWKGVNERMTSGWQESNKSDVKRRNNLGCLNQYMCTELRLWNSQDHEAV